MTPRRPVEPETIAAAGDPLADRDDRDEVGLHPVPATAGGAVALAAALVAGVPR